MAGITHDLTALFEQLGLDGDPASIDAFVAEHRPLAPEVPLAKAPFWSDAQSSFLDEAIATDGAWALVVDELDTRLR